MLSEYVRFFPYEREGGAKCEDYVEINGFPTPVVPEQEKMMVVHKPSLYQYSCRVFANIAAWSSAERKLIAEGIQAHPLWVLSQKQKR